MFWNVIEQNRIVSNNYRPQQMAECLELLEKDKITKCSFLITVWKGRGEGWHRCYTRETDKKYIVFKS